MAEERDFHRMPGRDRLIADIKQDDIRVRVVGMIIDKVGDSLILDDGSGKVTVMLDAPTEFGIKHQVRVLGRVMQADGGGEIHGEVLQDMAKLNMPLYRKIVAGKE